METEQILGGELQLWQCNYFQQEKEIKRVEAATEPQWAMPQQKQAFAELLLDGDFKKSAWLPVKTIKHRSSYELSRLSGAHR